MRTRASRARGARSTRGRLAAALAVASMAAAVGCGENNYDSGPVQDPEALRDASTRLGALLYDRWWAVNGVAEPTETFALYSETAGTRTGADTHRCQECHGWDYLGVAGDYGRGPHFTGVVGVLPRAPTRSPGDLIDIVASGIAPVPDGLDPDGNPLPSDSGVTESHAFESALSTEDVEHLARFLLEGLTDPREAIDERGGSRGNPARGGELYRASLDVATPACAACHGTDGRAIDLADEGEDGGPITLGTRSRTDPWRTLHKIRWGDPGTTMPSLVALGISEAEIADVLAHLQTLP